MTARPRRTTAARRPAPVRAAARTAALTALLAAGLGACSGDEPAEEKSPAQVLADAKATLDGTSGLRLRLDTDDLPEGVSGIITADGVATSAPAFDGTITVPFAGQPVEVPVVAVDGSVYAQIPLTVGWSDVDPADYGAPDPAALIDPDTGLSSLLPATVQPTRGSSVRGGADNDEVLTEYSGTVPGEAVARVIPSASGDSFDAVYTVTDDGELREARLTGVFYADAPAMTYTVDFTQYGTTTEITAPTTGR